MCVRVAAITENAEIQIETLRCVSTRCQEELYVVPFELMVVISLDSNLEG